jgi:transcription elongation factor GreA
MLHPLSVEARRKGFFVLTRIKSMDKIPMTADGYEALEEELKRLKTTERPKIIKAIGAAREHGDLSENAEYHAARERQSFIEGRLAELEDVISRADVIDPKALSGKVVRFGATVKLADEDTDEQSTYQIVGSHESDAAKGKLSITSPLARALIGKSAGDSAEVNAPGGGKSYEIIRVQFK